MSDTLLSASIHLTDSILSSIYMGDFLKEKYQKKIVWAAWCITYFLIQMILFRLPENSFPAGEIVRPGLQVCVLLLLQLLFFERDMPKQFFAAFSFSAGKEIVKYIVSVFCFLLSELYSKILNYLAVREIVKDFDGSSIWIMVYTVVIMTLCTLLYALLLSMYLRFISRKFVKKDYPLQTHENVFLILPCAAALCISVILRMMTASTEHNRTILMYRTVPELTFWIPVICILLLCTIAASVILFQKLVQYHEESQKRAMLENQVQQMQKEIIEIQDIYTDMRGLGHDMRSHLSNISLLLKDTSGSVKEELENYIGKMEETVKRLDFAYHTGNPITDIIIHQKKQEAEKRQIQFKADFSYPPKLFIDVYDVAVILNNALENAIEACGRTEGVKEIALRSCQKGSLFFIEVENDFEEEIVMDKESGLPVSSKKKGKLHGIGISNIQRCAKNYMGDIDIVISCTNGRKKFSLTVMMNGKHKTPV